MFACASPHLAPEGVRIPPDMHAWGKRTVQVYKLETELKGLQDLRQKVVAARLETLQRIWLAYQPCICTTLVSKSATAAVFWTISMPLHLQAAGHIWSLGGTEGDLDGAQGLLGLT